MQISEAVIIGGGIVGSSIAYHLAVSGCRDVLVIERESAQGKGSTGKSMGRVRARFFTPVSIQMPLYSIPFYASFERLGRRPCDYRPHPATGNIFSNRILNGQTDLIDPSLLNLSRFAENRTIHQTEFCNKQSPCKNTTTG
jgi:choline dehydrogenase-like flavoprotein